MVLLSRARDIKQFREKCEAVFRPELHQNKGLDRFIVPKKR